LEAEYMPTQPKPFYVRGWWVTDAGGRRTRLVEGPKNRETFKLAKRALHELLSKEPEERAVSTLAVWELCEQFLDWVKIHRSAKLFTDYHICLTRWVKECGKRPARDIRPLDLEHLKTALVREGYKPCTTNHYVVAVQTCWSWGVKNDLLASNPLAKVEKLHAEGRQRVMTAEEFRSLLRHSDALFRQVLLVLRLTGLRPGEFCKLAWEAVDWESHCFVIRKHKASRTAKEKKPRIVPFPPVVERLLRRAQAAGQSNPFLNEDGNPWKYNALRCRMRRLRERARIVPDENGETIVLYTARHSYATTAVASGVSDRRLADLMGHTNTRTTGRYVHLAHPDLYKAALEATEGIIGRRSNGS
jgi:integrase